MGSAGVGEARVPRPPQPVAGRAPRPLARITAIAPELMFGSRIAETLGAAGHDVAISPAIAEARELERADVLIADLDCEPADALVGLGMPVLGFYSHTDVDTRKTAEAAGVDIVVPRSRMVREMPELVERLLAEPRP